ncbi:hypothetical protein BDQ12DRAFT_668466 [Crucibulum laeve]|uniref:Glycoside hydrolase superfamily n=1 Tax=Crucibulum laeve TaxID=68775 RepID=A0A5C3LU29_9AGAR|nr:hypothetical protein BDQ12DRAFT_668466 [Crucibulum laeve]
MPAGVTQINNNVQTFRVACIEYGARRFVSLTVGNELNNWPSNIMAKSSTCEANIRDNPSLCRANFVGANAHIYQKSNADLVTFESPSGLESRGRNIGVTVPFRYVSVSVYAFEHDAQLWKGNDNERSFGFFGKIQLNSKAFNPC